MVLNRNMHPIDRAMRVILGFVLIYLGFFNNEIISDPIFASITGVFGVMNFVFAIVGVCPVYILAGINTLKKISPTH